MQTLAILFVDVETLYWTCVLHKFTHRFCGRRPDTESVTTPDKSTNHILEELDKKILIIFTVRCSRLHPIWRSIPSTYTITVLHPFILLRFIGAIDIKQAFLWRKIWRNFLLQISVNLRASGAPSAFLIRSWTFSEVSSTGCIVHCAGQSGVLCLNQRPYTCSEILLLSWDLPRPNLPPGPLLLQSNSRVKSLSHFWRHFHALHAICKLYYILA